MEYKNILVTVTDAIATITFHRPAVLNALNIETLTELEAALTTVEADPKTLVLILTGEGKAFIAGADIGAMRQMTPLQAREFASLGHRVLRHLEHSRLIVIAAVNGFALGGGCEVMMACDLMLAASTAKIGQPEINLGIHPGFGGTQRLPRLVGTAKAKELLLTGAPITAEEAARIGLVNKVVPAEKLPEETHQLAMQIAGKSPLQLAYIKALVNTGSEIELSAASELEITSFAASFLSHDQQEGMAAFIEKRPAKFTGQ
jgi:enoyl-CoA hydratase